MIKLKEGDKVYHVYAFPDKGHCWITAMTIVKTGTNMTTGAASIYVLKEDYNFIDELSLQDCNVTPNKYNCHRLFRTRLAAETYISNPALWKPLASTREEYLNKSEWDDILNSQDWWDDYYEV